MWLYTAPGEFSLLEGDCRAWMPTFEESCIDSIVTDPPYGLKFLGKEWDNLGKGEGIERWNQEWAREALRVLKPGGHMLVAGIGRTFHRMMVGVEDVGFELRNVIYHIFGSGFPKNMDVAKAIDRQLGIEREVVGTEEVGVGMQGNQMHAGRPREVQVRDKTVATSEEAKRWEGWGTGLKPAVEVWALFRKPLGERNITENLMRWGTGALNIDGCRIPLGADSAAKVGWQGAPNEGSYYPSGFREDPRLGGRGDWEGGKAGYMGYAGGRASSSPLGRHPANLILSHDEDCQEGECVGGCPVRIMGEQSGERKAGGDVTSRESGKGYMEGWFGKDGADKFQGYSAPGTAARFFYQAKPSTKERDLGCGDLYWKREGPGKYTAISKAEYNALPEANRVSGNIHPTVKSIRLMSYLIRLVTPPGGLILDPFAGSGSTALAAYLEGMGCIGIEQDPVAAEIARKRWGAREGLRQGRD